MNSHYILEDDNLDSRYMYVRLCDLDIPIEK